ncbi:MAG: 1-acyl-sn-glycerol-3-phosphate acyltransferase [Bdellovibrionaceae bacterium]|nr:1-acyl-sn-glycerol-3-phosphate acyltransferase [Pseudobdellovibrionaceae bacterium]
MIKEKEWDYENEQWMKLPPHLKHLPLFTRHRDLTSYFFRVLWAFYLKQIGFRIYISLDVRGSFQEIYKKHKRLLLISNHASHLDATSIAAAVPFALWSHLYITAAKDYFFSNPVFTFFSKHCLGAIPIDRKDKKGEAVNLCLSLLKQLDSIWMILFPEGTRSKDGRIQTFRKGVSLFAQQTNTPILFLYIEGNSDLWPKGQLIPSPGKLTIHIGPVHDPAPADVLHKAYITWVKSVDPAAQVTDSSHF